MNVLAALVLGLLIGWLAEWVIDWVYWRNLLTNVPGTRVEVVGGPECIPHFIGAYLWWQVKLPDGQIGCSAEGSMLGEFYFMEPSEQGRFVAECRMRTWRHIPEAQRRWATCQNQLRRAKSPTYSIKSPKNSFTISWNSSGFDWCGT